MAIEWERELREAAASRSTLTCAPPKLTNRLELVRRALEANPLPDERGDHLLVRTQDGDRWHSLRHSVGIGTSDENDLQLTSAYVSRKHCFLQRTDAGWLLQDVGAKNKIYVNGQDVRKRLLRNGDIIRVGDVTLIFVAESDAELNQ